MKIPLWMMRKVDGAVLATPTPTQTRTPTSTPTSTATPTLSQESDPASSHPEQNKDVSAREKRYNSNSHEVQNYTLMVFSFYNY